MPRSGYIGPFAPYSKCGSNLIINIILGSQSINRQRVLREAGIKFEILPADIDEKHIRSDDYSRLPLLVARAKADALISKISEPALLITADTVTVYRDELREKPADTTEARRFLESYDATTPIQVFTGLIVTNTQTGQRAEGVDEAALYVNKISDDLIEILLKDKETLTVAGGFTIYNPLLRALFIRYDGSEASLAGMPLHLLRGLLEKVSS